VRRAAALLPSLAASAVGCAITRPTDRLLAILNAELTMDDVKAMTPTRRRKLASLLHHWWQLTEGPPPAEARQADRKGGAS
jgi:hypothetical protein